MRLSLISPQSSTTLKIYALENSAPILENVYTLLNIPVHNWCTLSIVSLDMLPPHPHHSDKESSTSYDNFMDDPIIIYHVPFWNWRHSHTQTPENKYPQETSTLDIYSRVLLIFQTAENSTTSMTKITSREFSFASLMLRSNGKPKLNNTPQQTKLTWRCIYSTLPQKWCNGSEPSSKISTLWHQALLTPSTRTINLQLKSLETNTLQVRWLI